MRSPLPAGNVVHSSLSSLSSLRRGGPAGGKGSGGGRGLGEGVGGGGGELGGGGRGHFIHPAIHCTTTWCFALKGLRTTTKHHQMQKISKIMQHSKMQETGRSSVQKRGVVACSKYTSLQTSVFAMQISVNRKQVQAPRSELSTTLDDKRILLTFTFLLPSSPFPTFWTCHISGCPTPFLQTIKHPGAAFAFFWWRRKFEFGVSLPPDPGSVVVVDSTNRIAARCVVQTDSS